MKTYPVCSAFTSRQTSLIASNRTSVFLKLEY